MTADPSDRWCGRTALVTGASAGIGRAIAAALVARGVSVGVVGRDRTRLDAACQWLRVVARGNARVLPLPLDLSVSGAGALSVERTLSTYGRLDHLVNNVGGLEATPIAEGTREACAATLDLNLLSAVECSSAAVRVMERGASVLNVVSVSAHAPSAGTGLYPVAKAALLMYTKCLALSVADRGIRVNALSPGPVDTDVWERLGGENADRWREAVAGRVPLGRLGTPGEMAGWAIHLLDPEATWVTGTEVVLDGGMTLR